MTGTPGDGNRENDKARCWLGESWERLVEEEFLEGVDGRLSSHFGNGVGEGNALGADPHAILGVSTGVNATTLHQGIESHSGVHLARGVCVEEPDLADARRADKIAVLIDLGTGFEAATAGHALAEFVELGAFLLGNARSGTEGVSSINGNPCLHPAEVIEHAGAVHH